MTTEQALEQQRQCQTDLLDIKLVYTVFYKFVQIHGMYKTKSEP